MHILGAQPDVLRSGQKKDPSPLSYQKQNARSLTGPAQFKVLTKQRGLNERKYSQSQWRGEGRVIVFIGHVTALNKRKE